LAYGAAMGAWRGPLLGAYVALKLPLLLVLTALFNAAVNGLFARHLGLELGFAQSLRAVLLSFGVAALVLGSLAPVFLFFDLALPGHDSERARLGHDVLGLSHVVLIAIAGTAAVLRQKRWLSEVFPGSPAGLRVVLAWLAVNLLVGAQLSWNLRPWFGTPGLEIEFLREDALRGSFYESVYKMVLHQLS